MAQQAEKVVEQETKTDIVEFSKTEAALAALEHEYSSVPDFSSNEGYEAGKEGIKMLVSLRTSLNKKRMELNAADQERINHRNEEAKRITARLVALETPLKDAKQLVDQEAEKRKQAAREAEEKRIASIKQKVESIQKHQQIGATATADEIRGYIEHLEGLTINAKEYGEFLEAAQATVEDSLAHLRKVLAEREEYERGQAEIERQKAEIEAQQEEIRKQQEELAAAKAEREEAERKEAAKKAEEARRQREEQEKAEREEAERQRAEAMKPDKTKLEGLAKRIESLKLADCNTDVGKEIVAGVALSLNRIAERIRERIQ